jgi:hypothetical protein
LYGAYSSYHIDIAGLILILVWMCVCRSLIGQGVGVTTLVFDLKPPPPPPAPPPTCTKPVIADFYNKACAARGCHTSLCPGCFMEVGVTHSAGSAEGCCAACGANPGCNAYT